MSLCWQVIALLSHTKTPDSAPLGPSFLHAVPPDGFQDPRYGKNCPDPSPAPRQTTVTEFWAQGHPEPTGRQQFLPMPLPLGIPLGAGILHRHRHTTQDTEGKQGPDSHQSVGNSPRHDHGPLSPQPRTQKLGEVKKLAQGHIAAKYQERSV